LILHDNPCTLFPHHFDIVSIDTSKEWRVTIMSRIIFILSAIVIFTVSAIAQKDQGKELRDAVDRVEKASAVITEIMGTPEKSIPSDLLSKAKAVVVFPGAIKGGFIVGAQGGRGVAVRRVGTGWSAPAFLNMAGGSVGLQIGGQKTDYVMLIMNDKGLQGLLQDKFEVGGEGSVAAGPVGRTAAASTNATLDAEILTYSRSKGVFAGLSLKGVVISQDKDMNTAVYQKSASQILSNPPLPMASAPATLQKFPRTLANYTK
jgi:lipid-binding SYLF domain-containing protein